VDIVKLALVAPPGTVTLAGTVTTQAWEPERDNVTSAPPAGAGTLRVTVPVDVLPADTLSGLRLKEEIVAGAISRDMYLVSPP
jgi:hypothetical protein